MTPKSEHDLTTRFLTTFPSAPTDTHTTIPHSRKHRNTNTHARKTHRAPTNTTGAHHTPRTRILSVTIPNILRSRTQRI